MYGIRNKMNATGGTDIPESNIDNVRKVSIDNMNRLEGYQAQPSTSLSKTHPEEPAN